MTDGEELTSWLESRRLIISKLSSLEADLREYGQKVERALEMTRERHSEATEKIAEQMAEVRVNIAMMEVKIKIWSAVIGLTASGVMTFITQTFLKH
jgi:hypothetical protein